MAPMTPKERWKNAMARKGVDRLPIDYWATGEMTAKLKSALGVDSDEGIWKALEIDRMHWVGCDFCDPLEDKRIGADIWGVRYRRVAYGAGTYDEAIHHPLAALETVAELEKYPWPRHEWWTAGDIRGECQAQARWPIQGGGYEPFLLYCHMRGLEQAFMDMIEAPEFAECALQHIFDVLYPVIEKTLVAGGGLVDFVYVAEDLASQESLLFSKAAFGRFLKPRIARVIELAHKHGAKAFYHTDGAAYPLIGELVECGIDVLNPVQWRCAGMERERLKREFGAHVTFHGGVDNQHTLPFGSPDEVRREVRDNIRILGAGGGYVLAPCHNIQPITPVENVLAMYDEAKKAQ